VATRINVAQALKMRKGAGLYALQPDDVVYVPKRWLSSAAEISQELGALLFFRGMGITFEGSKLFGIDEP
jgi:hypothetical protein